jgi:hypothetical protein
MSKEEGKKLSTERIILIVVTILLVIAVAYIGISSLLKGKEKTAAGTAPGAATPVPVEEAQILQPTQEQPAQPEQAEEEAGVTPTARRLVLPPTPTPFHTTMEGDVRAILDLSKPDYFDYFDEETWYGYDVAETAAYQVVDGQLVGKDYQPEEQYVYWSYTDPQSGNVYAEISITNGDCIEKDSVGLVIRGQENRVPSGYALEVSCDGAWRLRRHRGNKAPEELVDWTSSEAINTGLGATNRLGIWGYQGQFTIFLNGTKVGEHLDSDYAETYGYFAVYVRASRTFDLTATFDDFAFWHIPFIP